MGLISRVSSRTYRPNKKMSFDYAMDDNSYEIEYSEQSDDSNTDYHLENIYYEAKAKRILNENEAILDFNTLIETENEHAMGKWGFKSIKQICKIYFKMKKFDLFLEKFESLMNYLNLDYIIE